MPKPTQVHTKLVGRRSAPPPAVRLLESILPMLATTGRELPRVNETGWVFEPKYDGIRILAFVAGGSVALITRNGNEKSAQFLEIVEALQRLWKARQRPFVLDGEIVALDAEGPARFQALQSRMHLSDAAVIA